MKVIVWDDGTYLKVFSPSQNARRKDESEEDFLNRMAVKLGVADYRFIPIDELPAGRANRGCWKLDGSKVELDRDRAIRRRVERLLDKSYERRRQLTEDILATDKQSVKDDKTDQLKRHKKLLDVLTADPTSVFDGVPTEEIAFFEPTDF